MEERENILVNTCSFAGVKPVMVDLPYPPAEIRFMQIC